MSEVRVRFAPSPTGFFHIGSARTALFNWLYARHTGGTFVLRIEDTDAARNTQESLRVLLEGMKWLGMDWDEGPDKGGDYGPYFQSERGELYQEYIEDLRSIGRAYEKDGATWFKIEGERYTVWDEYRGKEVEKVKVEPTVFEDAVLGRVEKAVDEDFVIARADGSPVFHLVNVVDDITMNISHVIRGVDHLSNTPRHVELFRAFRKTPPQFAHIPLILKSEGTGKMSKRDKGSLIEEYEQRGFLPDAVRNYLALLGWNPKDDTEIMPIERLIECFDLDGINKDNARFDERKLEHFNTEYLRSLPLETFAWLARPRLTDAGVLSEEVEENYLQDVLRICQEKARSFEDLPSYLAYFFNDEFEKDDKVLTKLSKKGDPAEKLAQLIPVLESLEPWTAPAIDDAITALAEEHGGKKFDYFPLARYGVSGQGGGPDLLLMLKVLGKDRVVTRLKALADSLS